MTFPASRTRRVPPAPREVDVSTHRLATSGPGRVTPTGEQLIRIPAQRISSEASTCRHRHAATQSLRDLWRVTRTVAVGIIVGLASAVVFVIWAVTL